MDKRDGIQVLRHYLTLLLVGQPVLRRTLSLQMHEPLRRRIAMQLQRTAPSNHEHYKLLQADRTIGNRRGMPD